MIKFADIITNAGIETEKFPKSSEINVEFYDEKNRIVPDETVKYAKPFFNENPDSLINFKSFITGLEKEAISSMNVKVDENYVILFFKSSRVIFFPRKHCSMESIDYME